MQGGAGSSKGAVIKMAEAEGDGAAVGHRSSAEGVCEGAAERVQEDSSAHEHHIIQPECAGEGRNLQIAVVSTVDVKYT